MRKFINDYWDPYAGGIKTVVQLLLYMAIYFSFTFFQNPILGYIALILAVIGGIISIYDKLLYRAGNKAYFLIPTKNDGYSKMTALVLAAIVIVLAVVYFWVNQSALLPLAGLFIGTVIFVNGLYSLPGCRVDVTNNKITIGPTLKEVDVRQLKEIEILPDHLLLTIYDERQRIGNLAIDSKTALMIVDYLNDKIPDSQVVIIISVPADAVAYA